MKIVDLVCPVCGTSVVQSRCDDCRRRKIRSYICQKCNANVPNPEYGDPE